MVVLSRQTPKSKGPPLAVVDGWVLAVDRVAEEPQLVLTRHVERVLVAWLGLMPVIAGDSYQCLMVAAMPQPLGGALVELWLGLVGGAVEVL